MSDNEAIPTPTSDIPPSSSTAYCVRCRQKVPLVNPTIKFNTRGVKMLQANCPNANCGSKVNTFVKKDPSPAALPDSAISTDGVVVAPTTTIKRKKQKTSSDGACATTTVVEPVSA